jgi:hypothetical protein
VNLPIRLSNYYLRKFTDGRMGPAPPNHQKKCIKIEQKYINLLQPEYNILQMAGSS